MSARRQVVQEPTQEASIEALATLVAEEEEPLTHQQVVATARAKSEARNAEQLKKNRRTHTNPTSERSDFERKGFHCLDVWDGNHNGFEDIVRDFLNDPGSMETYDTQVSPVENGEHYIKMDFGARNKYGGMERITAVGIYDHETCKATFLSFE